MARQVGIRFGFNPLANWPLVVLSITATFCLQSLGQELPEQIKVHSGPINSVVIENGNQQVAIYGADPSQAPRCQAVLLTHQRRDVVWRAADLIAASVTAYGPASEVPLLAKADEFWRKLAAARFHDYQCQTTKVVTRPINISPVRESMELELAGLKFDVIDTPGYTAGSVTYLLTVQDKKIALVGDLIYGDGQLIDLYSFQDGIEAASIRGYHGYAARLASLVSSLKKVKAQQPDVLIPARGPVIFDPASAIDKLITRVQAVYLNYFMVDPKNWAQDKLDFCQT